MKPRNSDPHAGLLRLKPKPTRLPPQIREVPCSAQRIAKCRDYAVTLAFARAIAHDLLIHSPRSAHSPRVLRIIRESPPLAIDRPMNMSTPSRH